jgi:antitoxin (DNA-binding transcriptional repressor) of toxin-antitoxin stability system
MSVSTILSVIVSLTKHSYADRMSARTLTSSEAKANLGEVLGTLTSDGPVEITRNGHPVAVISAPLQPGPGVGTSRLPALATLYAAGKVTWRDIANETGIAFGDLLLELGRQGLELPQVRAERTPAQERLFRSMLRKAAAKGR